MRLLSVNILSNYAGRAWGFLSLFIFTPIYFKYLGADSFGVVGLYTAIVAVLMLGDFGLSSSLNRRLAWLSSNNTNAMPSALRTNEALILLIVSVISIVYFLAISFSSLELLNNTYEDLRRKSILSHLVFFCSLAQVITNFYFSGLMGLERQVRANIAKVLCGASMGIGSTVGLIFFEFDLIDFFSWQLACSFFYLVTLRTLLWRLVWGYSDSAAILSVGELKTTGGFASGVFFMSILSVFIGQFDKYAVTNWLGIEALSYYTLASTAAMLPIILVSPIGVAMYPRFSSLLSMAKNEDAQRLLIDSFRIIINFVLPIIIILVLQRDYILGLWLRDDIAVNEISVPFSFLVIGQFLQAATLMFYYFILASGRVSLSVFVSIFSAIFYVPTCLFLITITGIKGVAGSFLVMNIIIFPFYIFIIKNYFFKSITIRFFNKLDWVSFFLYAVLCCALSGYDISEHSSVVNFLYDFIAVLSLAIINLFVQIFSGNLNFKSLRA